MKFYKILLTIPLVLFLVACKERFRYPCQDPDNWENKECKKPYCTATSTCPEDFVTYEKERSADVVKLPAVNQCVQSSNSGACK